MDFVYTSSWFLYVSETWIQQKKGGYGIRFKEEDILYKCRHIILYNKQN